jgi:hypothetical protein
MREDLVEHGFEVLPVGQRLLRLLLDHLVKVATTEHETKWLELALRSSIDELTLAVRLARKGEAPRSPDDRKGLPEVRMKIDAQVPPEIYAKWEHVRRVIEEG